MSNSSLTREEAIRLYGTEAATGWGREAADQNFGQANTSTNSTSGGFDWSTPTFDPSTIPISQPTLTPNTINVDDFINAIRDTLPEPPEEYMKANPFWFDEQAAIELATAEFSPYYDELLQDYLGDIKLISEKNRGDAIRTLADLDKQKEIFVRNNSQDFEKMIRGIKEGYSSKGLYFGGENKRSQVEAQNENTNKLEGYLGTYGSKKEQTISDEAYQQEQARILAERKARDLARERDTAIASQVNQLEDEAIDEWVYAMKLYYDNPNWKSMIPPEPPKDVPVENLPVINPPTEEGGQATVSLAPTEQNPEPVSAPIGDVVGEALPDGPPSVTIPVESPALKPYTSVRGAIGPKTPSPTDRRYEPWIEEGISYDEWMARQNSHFPDIPGQIPFYKSATTDRGLVSSGYVPPTQSDYDSRVSSLSSYSKPANPYSAFPNAGKDVSALKSYLSNKEQPSYTKSTLPIYQETGNTSLQQGIHY